MSADISTFVTISGTEEELVRMLMAIKNFEKESQRQYRKSGNCGYIDGAALKTPSGRVYLSEFTDKQLQSLIYNRAYAEVEISGPWGHYIEPREVPLFERIADAAPRASFTGMTGGEKSGCDVETEAVLKEGILSIKGFYNSGEDDEDSYYEDLLSRIPRDEFCSLFHITFTDDESWDDDYYRDWMFDYVANGNFSPDTTLDEFRDMFFRGEKIELDEQSFEEAKAVFAARGIVPYIDFVGTRKHDPDSICEYDPCTHKYTRIKDWRNIPIGNAE